MKNKTLKLVALLAIAAIGLYALNKSKKTNKKAEELVDSGLTQATKENPLVVKIPQNQELNIEMVYTFNGTDYIKQLMGPTVKSVPQKITKEEFDKVYQEFLL